MEKEAEEMSAGEATPTPVECGNNDKQPAPAESTVKAPSEANQDDDDYPPLSKIISVGVTMMMVILLVCANRAGLTTVTN